MEDMKHPEAGMSYEELKASGKIWRMGDHLFKELFGQEAGKNRTLSLINSIVGPDPNHDTFVDLVFHNVEFNPLQPEGKSMRLDLLCSTETGTFINVEMQVLNKHDLFERAFCYWGRVYLGQIKAGRLYADTRPVITIFLLNYEVDDFKNCEDYMNRVYLVHEKLGRIPAADKILFFFVELPKWAKQQKKAGNRLEQWLTFLLGKNPDEIEEIAMSEQAISDALRAERSWIETPEGRAFYDIDAFNAYEARCEAESNKRIGRAEGRIEGRIEGRAEGIRETAQKAFELDIPFEVIEQMTSLPVPELLAIQAEVQRQRSGAIPG